MASTITTSNIVLSRPARLRRGIGGSGGGSGGTRATQKLPRASPSPSLVVAAASLEGERVLIGSGRGRGWDVTYARRDQLKQVSDTQAAAFFEPVNPLIDPALLAYFGVGLADMRLVLRMRATS